MPAAAKIRVCKPNQQHGRRGIYYTCIATMTIRPHNKNWDLRLLRRISDKLLRQ